MFSTHRLWQQLHAAEKSLGDLPAELLIEILVIVASSFPAMSPALARTCRWVSDVTLPARMRHISVRGDHWAMVSLHTLLCSSQRAADSVRTLCAMTWEVSVHSGYSFYPDEKLLLPGIFRACTNLHLLACPLRTLENLGSVGGASFTGRPNRASRLMLFEDPNAAPRWSKYWASIFKTRNEIRRQVDKTLWVQLTLNTQALRDRLAVLEKQIPLLEREKGKIQRKLRTLRFPVLTLPVEVTSQIFIHALPDPPNSDSDIRYCQMQPRLYDAPLVFLRICRAWRAIALGTPGLWADIRLADGDLGVPTRVMLTDWIKRAGIGPLTLTLRLDSDSRNASWPKEEPFTQILQRASQWHDMSLCFVEDELSYKRFETRISGRITHLQRLRIFSRENVPPKLWGQLTRLTADPICVGDCLRVLSTALSLVECAFEDVVVEDERSTPYPASFVHQNLRSFVLNGHSTHTILSHLTLPALTTLRMWSCRDQPEEVDEIVHLLARSGAKLARIVLAIDYLAFLRIVPFVEETLTELVLNYMRRDEIMGVLRLLRDSLTFLPRLQSLEIVAQHIRHESWPPDDFEEDPNEPPYSDPNEDPDEPPYYDPEAPVVSREPEDMDYGTLVDALRVRWAQRPGSGDVGRLESFRMVWVPTNRPWFSRDEESWTYLGFDDKERAENWAWDRATSNGWRNAMSGKIEKDDARRSFLLGLFEENDLDQNDGIA
ncbi:hypothetical protein B0H16DRAFT_1900280 [Mycena metata]|uniref:F-box domain-containing protein n=1 Tax=Mycena metata TaxID=1033252 RepID=A0AAD7ME11_9AGAR|nr:hypothetical protein B0H16DRAFT_1900280 [Mycena metata]